MIIWINGPFGVGKTHTAYELHRRCTGSFLFDPEKVGFFLRKYLPRIDEVDFQYHPLWRKQVKENLAFCAKHAPVVIVPMTIVDDQIFDAIIEQLRKESIVVHHFSLVANRATIAKRIRQRGDRGDWAISRLDSCLNALNKEKYQQQIDTDNKDLDKVVELIASNVKLNLNKPRLSLLSRRLNWFKIYRKHLQRL